MACWYNFPLTSFMTCLVVSFFCLIALARTSNTILKKSGESRHSCLVPDLGDKFSIQK